MLRVQVRAKVYRGYAGYSINWRRWPNDWPQAVFCNTREGAEVIRAAVKTAHAARQITELSEIPLARLALREADQVISSVLLSGY
jgi:hypothetical protein